MRHRTFGRRLNRSVGHRKSLRRNLMNELFIHERINTTEAKAVQFAEMRNVSYPLLNVVNVLAMRWLRCMLVELL